MNIKSKKGYVLAMAILFVIILTIASIGLYASVGHLAKEIRVQETAYLRGYYTAVAGLRYAAILLKNPDSLQFDLVAHDYDVTGIELLPEVGGPYDPAEIGFFYDIGVSPGDLTITITEITDAADPNFGRYEVSATYQH